MTPEEAYPYWRFDMWTKGYGTYRDIDRMVGEGELTPFNKYPPKEVNQELNPDGEDPAC